MFFSHHYIRFSEKYICFSGMCEAQSTKTIGLRGMDFTLRAKCLLKHFASEKKNKWDFSHLFFRAYATHWVTPVRRTQMSGSMLRCRQPRCWHACDKAICQLTWRVDFCLQGSRKSLPQFLGTVQLPHRSLFGWGIQPYPLDMGWNGWLWAVDHLVLCWTHKVSVQNKTSGLFHQRM